MELCLPSPRLTSLSWSPNSSSLIWELLKSSSESMFAEVVVTGVAGRAGGTVVSGVCFLRGPSGGVRVSTSEALRLSAEGGVVGVWAEPSLAL